MDRARRLLKPTALFAAGVAVALGLATYLGGEAFVCRETAAAITHTLDTPAAVGGAALGADSLTLSAVTLGDAPWLTAERVVLDRGVRQLLAGDRRPSRIDLHHAAAELHFDAAHHLRTRLPHPARGAGPRPTIAIADGALTLHFDGEPDRHFAGVTATLADEGDLYVGRGTVDDPRWGGRWAITTRTDLAGNTALHLHHDGLHVTPDLLRTVPFVKAKVWEQFAAEGDTPVDLDVRFGPSYPTTHYRVELRPTNTRVRVPLVALEADAARGNVRVEDEVVTLADVAGRVADGALRLDGTLDFRGAGSAMQFKFAAQGIDLAKLPAAWDVPKAARGRLAGNATIHLRSENGRVSPTGDGEGRVTPAFGGLLLPVTLRVRLTADGQRVRFGVE